MPTRKCCLLRTGLFIAKFNWNNLKSFVAIKQNTKNWLNIKSCLEKSQIFVLRLSHFLTSEFYSFVINMNYFQIKIAFLVRYVHDKWSRGSEPMRLNLLFILIQFDDVCVWRWLNLAGGARAHTYKEKTLNFLKRRRLRPGRASALIKILHPGVLAHCAVA